MMRLTACILCYQQADIIGDTIEAALNQSRLPDEVLVVDDGSEDGSADVARSFSAVRLLRHEANLGRTAARNTLLAAATGDIVVYLDGDSIAEPTLFETLLAEYGNRRVGAVGGRGVEPGVGSKYDRWRRFHASQGWPRRTEDADYLFGLCFSVRRQLAQDLGGFRAPSEDLDLSLRIRDAGHRLVYTPEAVVRHVRTDDWASLQSLLNRWWFGGYVSYARNGRNAFAIQAWHLIREAFSGCGADLIRRRDLELARISMAVVPVKWRAVHRAMRTIRSGAA